MKVLQINSLYKTGSTGKITHDLHMGLLDNGIDSLVIYGRGNDISSKRIYKIGSEFESHIWKVFTMITGRIFGGCYTQTVRAINIILKEKPDIVHLQCINGYFINIYLLITWLKKHNIRTVLTLHAEFMFTGTCGHSYKCTKWKTGCGKCHIYKKETKSFFHDATHSSWKSLKNAFAGFRYIQVISVSDWLMKRAKESPILGAFNHKVIFNGLDTSIFHRYHFHESVKILNKDIDVNKPIIFHATPEFSTDINHLKGGYYIIELAKRLPEYEFIIAGSYKDINNPLPQNLYLLGKIDNQISLAKLYSISSCTVITSKRETFSMVCAESLCCGTPVAGFLAGGPESIAINKYSNFCQYGNIDMLINKVKQTTKITDYDNISRVAHSIYSKEKMTENYISCYKNLLDM